MKPKLNLLLFTILIFQFIPSQTQVAQPGETSARTGGGPVVHFHGDITENLDYSMIAVTVTPYAEALQVSASADFNDYLHFAAAYPEQREFIVRDLLPDRKYYIRAVSETAGAGAPNAFTTRAAAKGFVLRGLTTKGGANDQGTLFGFDPESRRFTKMNDYYHPEYFVTLHGNLVQTPGGFAAISISDGTGAGEIITISSEGEINVIDDYAAHNGSAILGSDNHLYVVDDWINFFRGGIYRIHSQGDDVHPLERIIYRFSDDHEGINPFLPLLETGGALFGTAPLEGDGGKGTIFRVKPDGSDFRVLHSFSGPDGDSPSGSLIEGPDGFLYGVTRSGGSGNRGTVFRLKPDGTEFSTVYSFEGNTGAGPVGSLLWYGDRLYGTTREGGAHNHGVIFALGPGGKKIKVLHHCDGATGANPTGGLVADGESTLYGMMARGGQSDLGVIFSIGTNGSRFQNLFDFSAESGGSPDGGLLLTYNFSNDIRETNVSAEAPLHSDENPVVSVFPNPFVDSFKAEVTSSAGGTLQFHISDSRGTIIRTYDTPADSPVEMGGDLATGVYILRVIHGGTVSTQKIIKN